MAREMAADIGDNVTVEMLRWAVTHCDGASTLNQAVAEFADAKRREANDLEHAERLFLYERYLETRRERERQQVEAAADRARKSAISAGPISKDSAYIVYQEAAADERIRFLVREPRLSLEEWIAAGEPSVHTIRGTRDLQKAASG
jgi:hypothetical protein